MAGVNAEEEEYKYLYGTRNVMYDQEGYPELNMAGKDGQDLSWNHTSRASAGYFGRINYDYKGIYLLELNGRYDGSSRFPHTDQWAFFPSASIGYRFSEEAYFAPLKHIVSNGKLRASFGEIGNEAVGDYMFEQLISQRLNNKSTGYIYWIENNNANANLLTMYNMPDLVSSTLTWERIRTLNIGLDLGLLNDELTIGFDWFQRENRDMLAPAQVLPNTLGASAPYENAGTLRTRGWELNLNWRHTFGDFDVYANFNIGDSKTKVTKWDNDSKLLSTYYTGKPTVTFSVLKPTVTSRKKTSPAKMQTAHGIMQTALQARQDWNPVISITARETSSSRIWTAMARLTVERHSRRPRRFESHRKLYATLRIQLPFRRSVERYRP